MDIKNMTFNIIWNVFDEYKQSIWPLDKANIGMDKLFF